MLLNRKAVKLYAHDLGKQINGDAMPALDRAVARILDEAARLSRGPHRIRAFEIDYAAGVK